MRINFPSNLTDTKYGKFARPFESTQHAIECALRGHAVIYWDEPKTQGEEPARCVGFLQAVTYSHRGPKYRVMSLNGFVFKYDHAEPIVYDRCPRVFVKTGNDVCTGALVGVKCDEYEVGDSPKFLVRVLPFETGTWQNVSADQLLFADNTEMGVGEAD